MRPWTLVEPFCGSGALSLSLLGAPRQLLPYQGSKWHVRKQLQSLLLRLGFWGAPAELVFQDVAPWPLVLLSVLQHREITVALLEALVLRGQGDPEGLYRELQGRKIPSYPPELAAEMLWLQRMSFNGKAVGVRVDAKGTARWKGPGLNKGSARGLPATDKFGEVRPMGQALMDAVRDCPEFQGVFGGWGSSQFTPAELMRPRPDSLVLAYLDPPYEGTEGYPSGHATRAQVVEQALEWDRLGATVVISEATPIPELGEGWTSEQIFRGRAAGSSFKRQKPEWTTFRARRAC